MYQARIVAVVISVVLEQPTLHHVERSIVQNVPDPGGENCV